MDDANFDDALPAVLRGARAAAGALPDPDRRHADHQGVHPHRLRPVREREGLRHLPVQGPGEVAAGRRPQPDGPVSFRELYGFMTADEKEELSQLKAASAARRTSSARTPRTSSSASGGAPIVTPRRRSGIIDEDEQLGGVEPRRGASAGRWPSRVYAQQEIEEGVVLNAAVILKDPTQLDRDHRGDAEGGREAAGLRPQGRHLAGGGGPHRAVRPGGQGWCSTSASSSSSWSRWSSSTTR